MDRYSQQHAPPEKCLNRPAPAEAKQASRCADHDELAWHAQFPKENPNPVLRLARDGRLLYVNPSGRATLGHLVSQEIAGPELAEPARQAMAEGRVLQAELAVADRVFSMTFHPVAEEIGVYGRDITQHKRTEESLREKEEQLRLMLAASKAGWWHWDLVNNKIMVDAQTKAFFGVAPDAEVSYQTFLKCLSPADATFYQGVVPDGFTQEGDFDAEFHVLWPDGSHHWVLGRGRAFCDDAGQPQRLMGLVMDITEHKLAEVERQRHREELAHAARLATMGELAASIAHELNQPLAAILCNAEAAELFLAEVPPALGDVREILADIRNDDHRAAEIIRRMRQLLQKRTFKPEPLDLGELITDVVRLIGSHATLHRVTTRVRFGHRLPKVLGDRVHLQQVLINLAINGMDAMADRQVDQRELLLSTTCPDPGRVEIRVRDCGSGIPREQLARLFEPFYTTKSNGMGIGLSIARTIVEAHGGRIWAENNPDGGATVGFTLPVEGTLL